MENTTLTNEESLVIIQKMINQAKVNVNSSSFYLLLWGWLIMLISLTHFILMKFTLVERPEMAWLGIFIGLIVSFIYGFVQGKKQKVITYADTLYTWVWMGFIVTFFLTSFYIGGAQNLIGSMSLVLAGFATFISGHIIKFKPLIFGGIIFWAGSLIGFLIGNEYSLLISSVTVLLGYIIPGHLLRNRVQNVTF